MKIIGREKMKAASCEERKFTVINGHKSNDKVYKKKYECKL